MKAFTGLSLSAYAHALRWLSAHVSLRYYNCNVSAITIVTLALSSLEYCLSAGSQSRDRKLLSLLAPEVTA